MSFTYFVNSSNAKDGIIYAKYTSTLFSEFSLYKCIFPEKLMDFIEYSNIYYEFLLERKNLLRKYI